VAQRFGVPHPRASQSPAKNSFNPRTQVQETNLGHPPPLYTFQRKAAVILSPRCGCSQVSIGQIRATGPADAAVAAPVAAEIGGEALLGPIGLGKLAFDGAVFGGSLYTCFVQHK
jgi:hypothetical protein